MQVGKLGPADARCILQYRLEDGFQFTWGRADDAQHVCRGGLLLQRFTQLGKQPRILDGYDGLGGEVLDQRNVLFSKRLNFLTVNGDCANQSVILKHWYYDQRSSAGDFDKRDPMRLPLPLYSSCRPLANLTHLLV